MSLRNLFCLIVVLIMVNIANATVSTFDDNYLPSESHWGGAGSGETGFTSANAWFGHNDGGYSWDGFVYSNMTDTTTAGYANQFSVCTGGGVNGSSNYGLSCNALDWEGGTYEPIGNIVSLTGAAEGYTVSGAYFTNSTYAYLTMRDGDGFTDKFGGASGDNPDWFKLSITGIDTNDEYTGTVDFYLADFRFTDNSQDYIVDNWRWVDLTSLGSIAGLEFVVMSSDVGDYGMNTPSYFAIDNLTVPEPATIILLGLGGLLLGRRRT